MSVQFNQYLIDFEDGTQEYLTAEDIEEVWEFINDYSSKDEVLGIYKCVWNNYDD